MISMNPLEWLVGSRGDSGSEFTTQHLEIVGATTHSAWGPNIDGRGKLAAGRAATALLFFQIGDVETDFVYPQNQLESYYTAPSCSCHSRCAKFCRFTFPASLWMRQLKWICW